MKKIAVVAFALFASLLISCSHSGDNVTPVSQKSLGLVVPGQSELSSHLILLKDGRTASPVSGIPEFDTIPVGNKLSLTFTTGSTHNGIVDIHVTQFASAQDSVFVPSQPSVDSTSFIGTFSGVAYAIADDSSSIATDTTSIQFTAPTHYSCAGVEGGYPSAGSGTFVVHDGMITFTDSVTNSANSLNGSFNFGFSSDNLYLYIWKEDNGTHYGFSLRRN